MQDDDDIYEVLRGCEPHMSTLIACRGLLRTLPIILLEQLTHSKTASESELVGERQLSFAMPGEDSSSTTPNREVPNSRFDQATLIGWSIYFVYMSCSFTKFQSGFCQIPMREKLEDMTVRGEKNVLANALGVLIDNNLHTGFNRHVTKDHVRFPRDLREVVRTSLYANPHKMAANEMMFDVERAKSVNSALELGQLPLLSSPEAQSLRLWYKFIKAYRSEPLSSYSLARWYHERLEGVPYLSALERDRLQIIDDFWEHGVSSVSYQITQSDDAFLRNQMVRGETLEIDKESGKIGVERGDEFDTERYQDALYKINMRVKGLLRDDLGNALQALKAPLEEFSEVFEEAGASPSRMHDAASNLLFATKYLLDCEEISDCLQTQQLLRDAENSILEFRASDPVTDAKARELARLKYKEPNEEQLAALVYAGEESSVVATLGIAKEIAEDVSVVRGDRLAPDDEKKMRSYRTVGRLHDMKHLGTQSADKIGARIKDSAAKADQVNKLVKFGNNVSGTWPVLRDWLFTWFY